jgi:hypothetical protein
MIPLARSPAGSNFPFKLHMHSRALFVPSKIPVRLSFHLQAIRNYKVTATPLHNMPCASWYFDNGESITSFFGRFGTSAMTYG